MHPRILADGIEIAKKETLSFLEQFKVDKPDVTKELLMDVARASLMTKVHPNIANPLTEILVDAVLTI